MNVLFRCRVEKPLLKKADKVTQSLGTSTGEMVRIFLAQIARTGRVPVSLGLEKDADILQTKATRNKLMRSLDDAESW
jgi:addiction module RelB/DinJ family antitoxin